MEEEEEEIISLETPRDYGNVFRRNELLINIFQVAYRSKDPMDTLQLYLVNTLGANTRLCVTQQDVVVLMSCIKWTLDGMANKEHPMHFIVEDLKALRARQHVSKNSETVNEMGCMDDKWLKRFCYFATCIPHVWCTKIIQPQPSDIGKVTVKGEFKSASVGYLQPGYPMCAFRGPNIPVSYIWIHASSIDKVSIVQCHMVSQKPHEACLSVYEHTRVGPLFLRKTNYTLQNTSVVEASVAGGDAASSIMHISLWIDTKDPPNISIFKPCPNQVFMIFISRDTKKKMSFVAAVLNDGKAEKTWIYPVAMHLLDA